jgi:Ca2+-transporting ATPase
MIKKEADQEEYAFWHSLSEEEVLKKLKTGINGLTEKEAKKRLKEVGKNRIVRIHKIRPFFIFLHQFKSFFVYLLFIAAFLSLLLNHWLDFYVIMGIIILNAFVGFIQNYKAEKAIQNLKKILVPKTKVIRNKVMLEINAEDIVPGDIIILSEGDKITADSRLIEARSLQTSEAILTGESMPVDKIVKKIDVDIGLTDRINMAYSGTSVVRGSAKAVVIGTGMNTELGRIARLVQEVKEGKTPFQKKIDRFARVLGILVIFIAVIVGVIGLYSGIDKVTMFLTSVSLAVAAVPEGLPAVITICLAIAVQRMYRVNSLIRKLGAAETLGRVTMICADKTGTLTQEKITVTDLFYDNKRINVNKLKKRTKEKTLRLLLRIGSLCNNAKFEIFKGKEFFFGDPTEIALLKNSINFGLNKERLAEKEPFIKEFAFTSTRKLMSVIRKRENKLINYVKGAPEVILSKCSKVLEDGRVKYLNKDKKKKLLSEYETLAKDGLRVLGFAFRYIDKKDLVEKDAEEGLIFVGFQGMLDLPRRGVRSAIDTCKTAGITVKMITGDSLTTAKAVGKKIGLEGEMLSGADITKLSDNELSKKLDEVVIFARVNPEHKLRLIRLLKEKKEIVAVTGDGVNDAPALKEAHIGVSMGIRGSDVARDVSDIVLTDDNFTSITKAVREGRKIFDNIKKFSYFLISSNFAEVLVIIFGLLFAFRLGWPTLLLLAPIQILWINLVSDGIIAITFSFEYEERTVMIRKPEKGEMFTKKILLLWVVLALIITTGVVLLFNNFSLNNAIKGQTIVFTALVFFEGFAALNFRSFKQPFYKLKVNRLLLGAILLSFIVQLLIVNLGILHPVFKTTFLSIEEWLIIIGVSASIFVLGELYKITKNLIALKKRSA